CPSTMGCGAWRPGCSCRSVWQMPVATSRMRISSARGSSSSSSSSAGASPVPRLTAAVTCMVLLLGIRVGDRRLRRPGYRQFTLPGNVIQLRPGVDRQALELPAAFLAGQVIDARADAEHEVGPVFHVVLDDLEEAAYINLAMLIARLHDEMVHQVLPANPPVLPPVPQRLQVCGDGRMTLDPSLPQVVEPGVRREGGQRHVEIGQVDAPGIAGIELLYFRAVERAQLPAHAHFSFGR